MLFETDIRIERAKAAQHKYTEMLMTNQHVFGVSVQPIEGYVHKPSEYALVVLVDDYGTPGIPRHLDNVPVIVQRVGQAATH